jgi:hypothetical protein
MFERLKKYGATLPATRVTNALLVILFLCVVVYKAFAVTPNPGHPWSEIGDGFWAATGTTALRTYGFPDTNADVLTDYNLVQGDLLYADAASSTARLPKDTNATRYLSNTGASNNPAWALINLANGVTGALSFSNGGTGSTFFNVAGPTAYHTYTFPDATSTILTTNAAVTVAQGGTGLTSLTANGIVVGNGASNPTFLTGTATGTELLYNGTTWAVASTTNIGVMAYGTTPLERWYTAPTTGTALTQAVLGTANVLRAYPFIVHKKTVFDRIAMNVTTLLSPSFIRFGIYRDGGNLYPSGLVVDSGAVSGATTGVKSVTISVTLDPGIYWLAYNTNSAATLQVRQFAVASMIPMLGFANTLGTASNLALTVASTCGTSCANALPSSYPASATALTTAPAVVWVRAAQ